ncbi:AraC family transcriptional regulator [Carboxylicivirga sp. M1479]|uniref:AraC family transcriptional regulator n=1 Tax=Carboxylicivirga sp. M1479 TaxID=2594476 RepID=UPI00117849F0|nr:AraC family transcriptional regulator [Carboxylicivirga sp. M1479]TRX71158.1 AraC family transcriptional regulator [Carboxylicivirga sp. M1479]
MKPFYTKATTQFDNSVTIRYDESEHFYPHWHYHDEYELVYIRKSSGIRYIGDSINPYQKGDLVLLGSKLPHVWINNDSSKESNSNNAASTVIHFQPKFINNNFFELPMMDNLKNLFMLSSRGIRFIHFNDIEGHLTEINNTTSTERIIAVFKLLSLLSQHKEIEFLSSSEYNQVVTAHQSDRLTVVHNYIAKHFKEKIKLETLAEKVHMTPQAFCTYFRNKTRKTVFTFINDLKIGYSCKLLIESDLNVDQIAIQSGYNNTTFFNRKFKEKLKVTPREYRKKFKSLLLVLDED